MRRRRFDHLAVELSVAVGKAIPRWDLYLSLQERGADPELLSRSHALAFCDEELQDWLRLRGLSLAARRRRRLRRSLSRFDPRFPTPEERLAALTD